MRNSAFTIIFSGFIFIAILIIAFTVYDKNDIKTIQSSDTKIDDVNIQKDDNSSNISENNLKNSDNLDAITNDNNSVDNVSEPLTPRDDSLDNIDNGSDIGVPENENSSTLKNTVEYYKIYDIASEDASEIFKKIAEEDAIGETVKKLGEQLGKDIDKIKKTFSPNSDNSSEKKDNSTEKEK